MLRCRSFLPVSGFSYMPCTAPLRATLGVARWPALPPPPPPPLDPPPSPPLLPLPLILSGTSEAPRAPRGDSGGRGRTEPGRRTCETTKNLVFKSVFRPVVDSTVDSTVDSSQKIPSPRYSSRLWLMYGILGSFFRVRK